MDTADKKSRPDAEPLKLDTILVQEVGQFGPYQLRSLILAAVIAIFTAWSAGEYIFTTARTPTRCFIEECDGEVPEYEPPWITVAVPATSSGFDNCARFENRTVPPDEQLPVDACPAQLFDPSATRPCDAYVYENTHSVVADFGLECDEWRRTLIGSIRTVGTLTVLPLTGFVSDRWGRRTALALNAFNQAWLGLVRYWSNTYIGFIISEFAEATFGSGAFSCAYILVTELVGPKYRVVAGATMNSFFSVGQVLLGTIARAVRPWRTLTLTLYAPQLITIAYFWVIAESVRWLLSKSRFDEATKVLHAAATANGKQLSPRAVESLRAAAERERVEAEQKAADRARAPWLPLLVLRSRPILLRVVVSPIWWISNTFIYYGMSINSVNLSGDGYFNYMAVSAIEIPGYWTAVYLLDRVGRRPVLCIAFWICAACQFGYIFMPDDLWSWSLSLYLVGKFCIAMVMTSVYVYTAELYPTEYRHSLFAFSSMMGRIGSITAPLTPALAQTVWHGLPSALFGSCALLSGCLILLTPETRGKRLPETMRDAELLGRTAPDSTKDRATSDSPS
ncbi:Organic cation transporter protein [Eumeta japonica]|uniref:Organic cation transporter protein n=1 Tax=Eumeta variegata TaxID=151549 RepID=A0A4C1WTK8_EUMVA|nr:Organic cation transporter protein [Eumeta japonica]